jgi:hypothetical protein
MAASLLLEPLHVRGIEIANQDLSHAASADSEMLAPGALGAQSAGSVPEKILIAAPEHTGLELQPRVGAACKSDLVGWRWVRCW